MKKDAAGPGPSTSSTPRDFEVVISARRVLRALVTVTAILAVVSVGGQAMIRYGPDFPLRDPIANLSNVGAEQSLPTLYSTLMLLVAAVLAGVIARIKKRTGGAYVAHWALMSALFTFMAIDEFASLHEQTVAPVQGLFDIHSGPLWFAWIIPGGVAVVAVSFLFLGFLGHLPPSTRRRMLTGGALFVAGAIGVELFEGWYASSNGYTMTYVLIETSEEVFEMLGAAVLLYALLAHIPALLPNAGSRLRVED